MNHTAICNAEAERAYSLRNFILHKLDERHFDALNWGNHASCLNGYCLDALDIMPAGGMEADTPGPVFHARGYRNRGRQVELVRGFTAAEILERNALADRLIAEILAEADAKGGAA